MTAHERGAITGAFYGASALGVLATMVDDDVNRGGLVGISLLATCIALASWTLRAHFSQGVTHLAAPVGSVMIASAVVFGRGGLGSMLSMTGYTFVALHVSLMASQRAAAWHLTWAATTLAASASIVWPLTTALRVDFAFFTICGTIAIVVGGLVGRLRQMARQDPLTGLANRSALLTALNDAADASLRTGEPITLVLLDLDGFKQVNDSEGHAAGDELLVAATGAWRKELRSGDTLARLGGDEFAVVLPGSNTAEATRTARRLCPVTPQIGCSFGVAEWRPGEALDALFAAADADLYEAKARLGSSREDRVIDDRR